MTTPPRAPAPARLYDLGLPPWAPPESRSARSAPRQALARRLGALAVLTLAVALPVVMVVVNRSAPAILGVAAILANAAALMGGHRAALADRYRALLTAPAGRLVIAVMLLLAVSRFWSIDPHMTIRGLVEGVPEVAFGFASAAAWPFVARPHHRRWLAGGLAAAVLLIVFEHGAGMPLHALAHLRGAEYDLKRSAVPPLLLMWPLVDGAGPRRLLASLGALAACVLAGAVVAHSGTVVFALAAALAAFAGACFAPSRSVRIVAALVVVLIALSPTLGALATAVLPARIESALSEEHAQHRVQIWTAFGNRVSERLWLGHGFDTSFKAWTLVRPGPAIGPVDTRPLYQNHPHSGFLQIWVELGLVGVAVTVLSLMFVSRRLLETRESVAARLALLVAVVAVALVGLSIWEPWWVASIAAALIWFERLDPDVVPAATPESAAPAA